ncbi:unnamed protein product [Closterium sp. NIES-65]|nr:unnamed protein product [Closterium sp. NIES-65]
MAGRPFFLHHISGTAVALLLVALLSQLPTTTRALPVSEMISTMKSNGIYYVHMERLFALDGTKDISGVTILVPRSGNIPDGETYASHDNTTRKYNQAIADALTLMYAASNSETRWTAASQKLLSPAVTKVLLDIWKFQIVNQYIPPSVAKQKYSSGGPIAAASRGAEASDSPPIQPPAQRRRLWSPSSSENVFVPPTFDEPADEDGVDAAAARAADDPEAFMARMSDSSGIDEHTPSLPAPHSAMPAFPCPSLAVLNFFQHTHYVPAPHSAIPQSPCHSFSPMRFPHAPGPAFWFSSPTLPLPAIPSLPCASLSRLAPHSGFPVPLYLSLPFRLSPALPSRALPRILVFQSHSSSPCHSVSPLRFPHAPCPAFWFSSPTLPLPAIPSLPCASLTRRAPHSGFPVPLYLSLPFLLSPALPSRALPRILVFQSHSTSPCHSVSPLRFPHAPCPAFWFSSPTLPLPAIPSLPCASLTRLAPHSGFPVPLYLSLPFLLSHALPSRAGPRILVFHSHSTSPCHSFSPLRFPHAPCPAFWFSSPTLPLHAIPSLPYASLSRLAPHSGFPVPLFLSLPFLLSPALPSRTLPRILVFQSHSTSPCHSFSPLRFPLTPCPAFWFSSPTLPLPAIPSLPCASLSHLAPHSGFPVPLLLSMPFLLSPTLPSHALPRILVFQSHSSSPCHSFSPLRFPLAPCPAFWFSSPTPPLHAIPSLPYASLSRLAPHSGFPVPLFLSLPFLLSPALPSRTLPRILVFQSHSTSPCHSFSPLRFPLAPCPAFWFSSPTLPLPAIPSLPYASLSRLAPHSGFPVPLYLSMPFLLSPTLPSHALPRILVFHSSSPCHSFSPLRFPLAPCPAFWFSSPTPPLHAIPSLPYASLSRLAPHSGFPVPLFLSLPFLLSPALPSRTLPRILVFQSHSTSPCHSFSPLRFPHAPCPAFWFSSPTLPLHAIPSLPYASLSRLAPHSGFPVPLFLSLPFLLSPALLSIIWPYSQSLFPTPQQDRLRIDDVVATLILSSDETIADGRGKAKGHPIYMSLGNIHHEDRWKPYGHALIATLPEFPAEYTSVDRLQIFQYVLHLVLQPLKDASHV